MHTPIHSRTSALTCFIRGVIHTPIHPRTAELPCFMRGVVHTPIHPVLLRCRRLELKPKKPAVKMKCSPLLLSTSPTPSDEERSALRGSKVKRRIRLAYKTAFLPQALKMVVLHCLPEVFICEELPALALCYDKVLLRHVMLVIIALRGHEEKESTTKIVFSAL
ncbi:hypothetical protein NDU88_007340 [Pleurodeles waltl]|uniref:Uncharacterized protein n=1 Tax=Pleurodeles waltl TaxID=8319 RepID=A0AAV7PM98_PLEWA|nr:hypothetical protein NDU88_007340 [Pleurodeles waltl]